MPRYDPAAQSVGVVVAKGQNCPGGQAKQLAMLVPAVAGLYVPGVQLVGLTDCTGQ